MLVQFIVPTFVFALFAGMVIKTVLVHRSRKKKTNKRLSKYSVWDTKGK